MLNCNRPTVAARRLHRAIGGVAQTTHAAPTAPRAIASTAVVASGAARNARGLGWAGLSLGCLLLLGAFLKFPEAVEVPGSDTGMYATYGAILLHGARPYVDFWDLHPPLVFGYWALVQALTGPDWLRTCLSIDMLAPQSCIGLAAHGLDLLLSVAAALVTAAIARRCGGSGATATLAALLVVGFADQAMLSQEGSNPSKLTLLPSGLAVWAYLASLDAQRGWRWALSAGGFGAIAGLAKQPALLTFAALACHAGWRRDRTRLGGLLSGGIATMAVACAALAVVGSLEGFDMEVWVYNIERMLIGYYTHPAKPPVIGLSRVLLESAGALAVFAVAGGLMIAHTPRHARQPILFGWALLNIVAVAVFREFVYVVPSIALLAAFGLERIWRRRGILSQPLGRGLFLVACVASLVLTTSFQRTQLARARFERASGGPPAVIEELGRTFRRDLPPGPLFIYGNGAELYPLADRTPATRYLNAEALRSTAPGAQATRAELVRTLAADPPPVIVLAPHSDEPELDLADYPALHALFQDCYARKPIRSDVDASWTVLVRTGACGSATPAA